MESMNNLLSKFPAHDAIFTRDFTVRYSEVNKFGKLKLHSLFDYLQQIAAEHANYLGFGMHDLYHKGMIWVLSKMSIKITGSFSPEQQITACTYPSGVERIFFRREFEISDKNTNEVLAQVSSFWLLLDAEKLRPLRRDVLQDVRLENPDLPVFIQKFPSPAADFSDMQEVFTSQVKFSQMDINQHLNNAQYANWIEDAIYEKLQKDFTFQEINIAFLQAQKYPDRITAAMELKDSGEFFISGENKEKNCTAFIASGMIS